MPSERALAGSFQMPFPETPPLGLLDEKYLFLKLSHIYFRRL